MKYIINLAEVNSSHIELVGGKNSSIGEMIQNLSHKGINIPGGFATTVDAYKIFLDQNDLNNKIKKVLSTLKTNNVSKLNKISSQIRRWIVEAPFSSELREEILRAYTQLKKPTVAVRSSAVAEDLANASFAGAHETYLNIKGDKNLLNAEQ